jgi:hypothetical protein
MAKKPDQREIELEPDALQRFERAVDAVVKGGPQHRTRKEDPSVSSVICPICFGFPAEGCQAYSRSAPIVLSLQIEESEYLLMGVSCYEPAEQTPCGLGVPAIRGEWGLLIHRAQKPL